MPLDFLLQSATAPAGGGSTGGGEGEVLKLLGALIAIFVGTKVLGEIAQRLKQPAVLGELIAGVLLGGSVLGIVDANDPVLRAMAEIGVIVLLFETGLHTELKSLLRVGSTATTVALAGVILPSAAGYAALVALGLRPTAALVCSAALCATSIGISARVLSDLGCLETTEGQVVLGAAVLDDIVGLVILSVVATLVGGEAISAVHVARTAGVAIAFVVAAVVVGLRVMPPAFRIVERVKSAGTLGLAGFAFAFLLSWLAARAGSALIVGAFAAGIVLFSIPQKREVESATTTIGHFFVPIFFASVGAAVDLRALASPRALGVGGLLIAVGIAGKVAAGYVPTWFRCRKLLVGVAMIPRGEVGLIFAQLGLTSGALDAGLFGAVMLMVLATTLVTPPLLTRVVARETTLELFGPTEVPGDGGIDDLVVGASKPERDTPER